MFSIFPVLTCFPTIASPFGDSDAHLAGTNSHHSQRHLQRWVSVHHLRFVPPSQRDRCGETVHGITWNIENNQPWLVGGMPTRLKNMKVSWDDYSQYMGKNMFQTTNQMNNRGYIYIHNINHTRKKKQNERIIGDVIYIYMGITWYNMVKH